MCYVLYELGMYAHVSRYVFPLGPKAVLASLMPTGGPYSDSTRFHLIYDLLMKKMPKRVNVTIREIDLPI